MSDAQPQGLSAEDKAALDRDIAAAKASVSTKEQLKDIEAIKEQVRKEAEKEAAMKAELDAARKAQEELQKELEKTKREATERLDKIQAHVDQMASSRAVVGGGDPFATPAPKIDIDSWSRDKVDRIEEASAAAFFGPDYDTMMRAARQ
jgi:DNA repair exonuclease SbcCD ATPase subunit